MLLDFFSLPKSGTAEALIVSLVCLAELCLDFIFLVDFKLHGHLCWRVGGCMGSPVV